MSMSATAVQIHDNQGEEAMLAYLLFTTKEKKAE